MMHLEFENILGEKVTENEYLLIEVVYQWHPADFDKEGIAALYKEFGMALIRDMLPRAEKMKQLEERKRKAEHEIFVCQKLMEAVKDGYDLKDLEERFGDQSSKTEKADQ